VALNEHGNLVYVLLNTLTCLCVCVCAFVRACLQVVVALNEHGNLVYVLLNTLTCLCVCVSVRLCVLACRWWWP